MLMFVLQIARPGRFLTFAVRACLLTVVVASVVHSPRAFAGPPPLAVPDGFEVELVAGPPLVEHPMMGCFDERGRLFLAESAGRNLNAEQLDEARPNSIRMLEDLDGDGVFDRHTVFADRLAIPNGAVWLDGSLYVAEPPGIWRLEDTDGDGVADVREHIAGQVRSNGMSSTLHGPTLHPGGRLFWCGGQMGYSLDPDKQPPEGGSAPGVFTLLPDGTEHEVYAVGGRANPVEVTFGESGDVFGTLAILDFPDGARHDALMHWVYGGLYPSRTNVPDTIHQTGPRLPPLSHVGQVAPAGITSYRGTHFGAEYQGNLFWTQFNTHKLMRTSLERAGASYAAADQDFAVSTSVDFHPTDVIEDADGSLLLIDTGGWFRHGCPTSRIARPQALGAIYRIRRKDRDKTKDPRGTMISWDTASVHRLIEYLGDHRPAVSDRAIATLANREADLVSPLRRALETSVDATVRLNCVWTLSRRGTPEAFDAMVPSLQDQSRRVRQAAANALGLARHRRAVEALLQVVSSDDDLIVRREAASALARIGKIDSVDPLIAALADSGDLFFQHAIIDALIRVGRTDPLVAALRHDAAAVRRGALLALNEIGGATIAPEELRPMLIDHDPPLREAAFAIAGQDARLRNLLAGTIRTLLLDDRVVGNADQRASLSSMLGDLDHLTEVQQAVAAGFAAAESGHEAKQLILDVIRLSDGRGFPDVWIPVVESALVSDDADLREQSIEIIASREIPKFDALLMEAASKNQLPDSLRIRCLEAVAPRLDHLPNDLFRFATDQLSSSEQSLNRATAARALSESTLSADQLRVVANQLTVAETLVLPSLLNCFGKSTDASTGRLLISAIDDRQNLNALPAEQVSALLRRFPAKIQDRAKPLLKRMGVNLQQQEQRMEKLLPLTKGGDVLRGKQVFFGEKASCSACHRVKGQGELVGPNLTTIATIRTPRDLLEAIIFPSASIVQDYRPVTVVTTRGRIVTGLVVRRTDQEWWLKASDLKEFRIRNEEIAEMREATTSIMPRGLEERLSSQELRDLFAFLQDLKPSRSYLLDEQ